MSLKKTLMLASMALAAMLFAAPAASASWLHDHDPITQNEIIEFEGQAGFGSGLGGTTCNVSGAIEATPNHPATEEHPETKTTTGHVIDFTIGTGEECTSTGTFAGCVITNTTVTNSATGKHINVSPLPVHIKEHHLVVTDLTIDTGYQHPSETCALQTEAGPIPVVGNALHFDEITLFDKDDGDSTTVNTLGASGKGEITLYNTTPAQEANAPFATGEVSVNEGETTLTLVDQDTWGWNGTG